MPSMKKGDKSFPYNPYKDTEDTNEGPVPYADRKEEVARLRKKKKGRLGKRPKVIIASVIVVLVLIVGASSVAFASSAMDAKNDAQSLMNDASQLKDQIISGDMSSAKETCDRISQTTTKLHDTTSSPLWAAATLIPFVGGDIQAVRVVSDSADVLIHNVLLPAMDAIPSNGLAGLMSDDGAVNVEVIDDLLTVLSDSAPQITECAERLDATPEPTIEQLKGPIDQVKTLVGTFAPIADSATELKETLPAILGAEGVRNYLIIACTSSEMRSSVGFAGSFGIMTVDNGKISLGDFEGANANPRLEASAPSATEEDKNLFRWESTVDSRDVTQIINFERVGEIESEIWEENGHGKVDGVIALDTIVLERMLALTGSSVTTPGGDVVDGTSASDFLLNGVYKKYPEGEMQDAIFALVADTAAKSVFGNIGQVNIADLAKTLKQSTEEGRISIYMANDAEEAMLEDFGLAGTVSSDSSVPETGVYMSACLGGKMFYYLASGINVGKGVKNSDGSYTYDVKVTFKNTLSDAEQATLTDYIKNGNETGTLQYLIYLLAPTGGKITDVQAEGDYFGADSYPIADFSITLEGSDDFNETTYQGNDLWIGWNMLAKGEETVITYKVTTSPDAESDLVVRTTPLARATEISYQD